MEHVKMFFYRKVYIELAFSLRMLRLGVGLRIHPMSTAISLGLVAVSLTVGVTYRPLCLRKKSLQQLRRRDDGYVRENEERHTASHTQ